MKPTRRQLLASLAGGVLAPRVAMGATATAKRVIFFYFPDGVAAQSQNGDLSKWHAYGSEFDFQLGDQMSALQPWKDQCVFFRGLSMGETDSGSHPGGAKKLLTAVSGGNGESIDQYLARTVGASSPWRHLYLGAQANVSGASGDKHISYPTAGVSIPPEDDPRRAFELLFGTSPSPPPAAGGLNRGSVLDTVITDLESLKARLGATEKTKLDLHLDAVRQLELRLEGIEPTETIEEASCEAPSLDASGVTDSNLYAPEAFGDILTAQIDLMVLAMACGLTKVGTIQASHHTSELIMSRIPGTSFHDPSYDMRSHQASHYGASHDYGNQLFWSYDQQRKWWAEQYAYLLQRLAETPEDGGTMLDHSIVVLCTEVCDGNTHLHDDLPMVIAGGASGRISTGRFLDVGYRRHGDVYASIAHAFGDYIGGWGEGSGGAVPGLVS